MVPVKNRTLPRDCRPSTPENKASHYKKSSVSDALPHPVYAEALALRDAGISTIPIRHDGSKAPALDGWAQYQEVLPNPDELSMQHRNGNGLAAVCGRVSGNLEDLDFDDPSLFEPWCALVRQTCPNLIQRLVVIRTPSGGYAVVYRFTGEAEGSKKLARGLRFIATEGKERPDTLIETKGEGGYFLAPPSPPTCHPANRPYEYLQGSLTKVTLLTPDERAVMLEAARSFNEIETPNRQERTQSSQEAGERPGDDFNENGPDWSAILEPHGWEAVDSRGDVTHWKRPGKAQGTSATTNYAGTDRLHVFSSNADPFEQDSEYSKFAAYALLNHEGDYSLAARELARQGYGTLTSGSSQASDEEPDFEGDKDAEIGWLRKQLEQKIVRIESLERDSGRLKDVLHIAGDARLKPADRIAVLAVCNLLDSYPSDHGLPEKPPVRLKAVDLGAVFGTSATKNEAKQYHNLVKTGSKYQRNLEELGVLESTRKRNEDGFDEVYARLVGMPDKSIPAAALETTQRRKDREYHAEYRCRSCGSDKVVPLTMRCLDCGEVHSAAETLQAAADYDQNNGIGAFSVPLTESVSKERVESRSIYPLTESVSGLILDSEETGTSSTPPAFDSSPLRQGRHQEMPSVGNAKTTVTASGRAVDAETGEILSDEDYELASTDAPLEIVVADEEPAADEPSKDAKAQDTAVASVEPCVIPQDEARSLYREYLKNGVMFDGNGRGQWYIVRFKTSWRPTPEMQRRFGAINHEMLDACVDSYGSGGPRYHSTQREKRAEEAEAAERRSRWAASPTGGRAA